MKRNSLLRTIIVNIGISFFFTAIIVVTIYSFFSDDIYSFISRINQTVMSTNTRLDSVSYDHEHKRLTKYPEYGAKYAYIDIPAIELHLPVYNGDSMDLLQHGVGQYVGSYFPGEGGSTLLAAHNNKGFFQRIDELQKGDIITIKANYGEFTYIVDSYQIVSEKDLDVFLIQDDKERLILYTCYPIRTKTIGRKTQRYVIYAYRDR